MSFESDFKTVECQIYCVRVADGTHDSPKESSVGKRLVTSKNVKDGRLELDSAYLISNDDFESINKRSKVDQWDLLVTMIGTVGEICLITDPNPDFAIKNVGLLKCGDELRARWLYYFLRSQQGQLLIEERKKGSTQQYLSLTDLRKLPISFPENIQVMRNSIDSLIRIDDRITLLRETNATLEAIAQALFKSWFVDFDPVRAKSEGRVPEGMDEATAALFPDAFEETELGMVPKGWSTASLGSVCKVTIGGLWGKDENESADLVNAISLRGVDLEHLREFGFAANAPIRWVKQDAMEKRRFSSDEVLIASSGAGPCGRALWAGADFESLYGTPVIFSNFVKRFKCSSTSMALYVDRLLADMRESREIWNYINGTSIPNLDDKLLLASKKIVIPSEQVIDAYAKIASAIYEKLYCKQAQALSNLRDTLLPRLISGKLRIADAEAELEKVST